jgi:RNA polymerase sigma-70 factor (sigma-E family)
VTDAARRRPHERRVDFDEFVRARVAALGRIAYLLTGDRHQAEDLVQVTLERCAVHWHRLDDPDAYARRVLYSRAVSWWRVRRRRRGEVLTDRPPEPAAGPVGDLDLRVVLQRALARLTPRQRAVLVLRFYEDHTERETARLLDVTVGTVKSQTRHALRRLRQLAPELADLVAPRSDDGVPLSDERVPREEVST